MSGSDLITADECSRAVYVGGLIAFFFGVGFTLAVQWLVRLIDDGSELKALKREKGAQP